MATQKNFVSYIIWLLFSVLLCFGTSAFLVNGYLAKFAGNSALMVGAICGTFVGLLLLFYFGRLLLGLIFRHVNSEKVIHFFKYVSPFLVLLISATRAIAYLFMHQPLKLTNATYFQAAMIKEPGNGPEFVLNGLSYVYTNTLHVLFLFWGNNPLSGVIFQMMLFVFTAIIGYAAIRRLSGILTATVSMIVFSILPITMNYVFSLTPELFLLFFFSIALFGISCIPEKIKKLGFHCFASFIPVFLLGIFLGFICYLNLYCISLLLFFPAFFAISVEAGGKKQQIVLLLSVLLGIICGFLLVFLFLQTIGQNIFPFFQSTVSLYAGSMGDIPVFLYPDISIWGIVPILAVVFFTIPGYAILSENRMGPFFCLQLILLLFANYFAVMDYSLHSSYLWCILCGLGVYSLMKKEEPAEEEEEIDTEEDKNDELKEKPTKQSSKPGEPLANPLPIPKKKKAKVLDFAYDVPEDKMCFDLDSTSDEDFDE